MFRVLNSMLKAVTWSCFDSRYLFFHFMVTVNLNSTSLLIYLDKKSQILNWITVSRLSFFEFKNKKIIMNNLSNISCVRVYSDNFIRMHLVWFLSEMNPVHMTEQNKKGNNTLLYMLINMGDQRNIPTWSTTWLWLIIAQICFMTLQVISIN